MKLSVTAENEMEIREAWKATGSTVNFLIWAKNALVMYARAVNTAKQEGRLQTDDFGNVFFAEKTSKPRKK